MIKQKLALKPRWCVSTNAKANHNILENENIKIFLAYNNTEVIRKPVKFYNIIRDSEAFLRNSLFLWLK